MGLRAAVQRVRSHSLFRRSTRKPSTSQKKQSIWTTIPNNILIRILALCDLTDINALTLACRVLHHRIYQHESAISQEYLCQRQRRRRRGHAPSSTSSSSPGDDLTFIADLFPPPPPQYTSDDRGGNGSCMHRDYNIPEYSFDYVADLTRCWRTCIRLSFYLAEAMVQHHLATDRIARSLWSSPKTEREVVYSKGVSLVQKRLLYPIAYLAFFLESHASSTSSPQSISIQTQQSIIQQHPFTNTHILLATHHCMTLLCAALRRLLSPDIQFPSTEPWLRLLLTTSTLERTLEFFMVAAKEEKESKNNGSRWTPRMEFIWQMRTDWEHVLTCADEAEAEAVATAGVEEVLFEAARREMDFRGVIPHDCEEGVPVLHGSVVRLRCEFCN